VDAGAVALIADAPRAEIDLNRDERELDPAMVQPRPPADSTVESPRPAAASGSSRRRRCRLDPRRPRARPYPRPYHAPSRPSSLRNRRSFDLARRPPRRQHGEALVGFAVARNAPYAGGHITERHGRPGRGIHALQLELDRSLYLAPDLRSTGPGFDRVARLIAAISEALAAAALEPPEAIAAE
jgi:N-formylglutamate amidohydrolase